MKFCEFNLNSGLESDVQYKRNLWGALALALKYIFIIKVLLI